MQLSGQALLQPALHQVTEIVDQGIICDIKQAIATAAAAHQPSTLQLRQLAADVGLREPRLCNQARHITRPTLQRAEQTQTRRLTQQAEKATQGIQKLRGGLLEAQSKRAMTIHALCKACDMASTGSEQAFWDQRFSTDHYAYGDQPNDFLREQAAQLPLGTALCLAEGEGRNGVHLASLGHHVTVQDLSPIGLEKAKALAHKRGVDVQTACSDLRQFKAEANSTDLVVAIWMHLEPQLRAQVHREAIKALRPGGHLLIEAYTPRQLRHRTGGPPQVELLIEPQALQQELMGLELLILQEQERLIHEGPLHQGMSAVVQALGRKPISP